MQPLLFLLFSCSVMSSSLWPSGYSIQASPSFTISWSLLKLMSIKSVMPSNHLILCHLLLLSSIFPSTGAFSKELALRIRWPNYWSFSLSISPSNEYSELISFRINWFDLLVAQVKSYHYKLCQNHQCWILPPWNSSELSHTLASLLSSSCPFRVLWLLFPPPWLCPLLFLSLFPSLGFTCHSICYQQWNIYQTFALREPQTYTSDSSLLSGCSSVTSKLTCPKLNPLSSPKQIDLLTLPVQWIASPSSWSWLRMVLWLILNYAVDMFAVPKVDSFYFSVLSLFMSSLEPPYARL